VTRETIAALERGQRGVYSVTLRKLAQGYGVSLSELLADHARLAAPKAEAPAPGQQDPEDFAGYIVYWSSYLDSHLSFDEIYEDAASAYNNMHHRIEDTDATVFKRARLAMLDDGKVLKVAIQIPRLSSKEATDAAWELLGLPVGEEDQVEDISTAWNRART